MSKKKLAIVTTGYKPVPAVKGGAVQVLNTYIIDQNEFSNEVEFDLYTIYDNGIDINKYKNTNIIMIKENRVISLFYKIINKINSKTFNFDFLLLDYPNQVKKIFKKNKYDKIIIENNMIVYKKIYRTVKNSNVKFYFHLHNDLCDKEKSMKNALFISKTAAKIICVSKYLSNSFDNKTGSNNSCVLYNCIDFNKFQIIGENNNFRKKLNLKDNTVYIYTGRIVKNKGVEELVIAFNNLNKKYRNINLLIVGFSSDGKESNFEKKIKKKIKDNKNIIALEFMSQNDLNQYLFFSDVVVIPTMINEGFGLVALEAMALSKAIIATNSGGLIEPLDDNCSIIIERDNIITNLEFEMEKLYKDEKLRVILGKKAYEKVHSIKSFDKNYYYENFMNMIDE